MKKYLLILVSALLFTGCNFSTESETTLSTDAMSLSSKTKSNISDKNISISNTIDTDIDSNSAQEIKDSFSNKTEEYFNYSKAKALEGYEYSRKKAVEGYEYSKVKGKEYANEAKEYIVEEFEKSWEEAKKKSEK